MSQQDDSAFVRTFIMVLAALVVFTISVFVLAQIMSGGVQTKGFATAEVAERTKPVGEVKTASAENTVTAAVAPVQKSGEEIYNAACMACHSTGAAGAPKLGDNAAWAPRVAKGNDALLNSALNGLNMMPAKGGNASLTDEDIGKVVTYLLASVQGNAPAEATPPTEQPVAPEAVQPATPEVAPPAAVQPVAPEPVPPAGGVQPTQQ